MYVLKSLHLVITVCPVTIKGITAAVSLPHVNFFVSHLPLWQVSFLFAQNKLFWSPIFVFFTPASHYLYILKKKKRKDTLPPPFSLPLEWFSISLILGKKNEKKRKFAKFLMASLRFFFHPLYILHTSWNTTRQVNWPLRPMFLFFLSVNFIKDDTGAIFHF